MVTFHHIDVEICHRNADRRCCITGFEAPESWSYDACEWLVRNLLRKTSVPVKLQPVKEEGVPSWLWRSQADMEAMVRLDEAERFSHEVSTKQIFHRMAGSWTYWGWKEGYFDTESDAKAFYDECCYLLASQKMAPAAPQWINDGLHWAYGIDSRTHGHYYVDSVSGKLVASKSACERPQHHASFIQGVSDSLVNDGGIMDLCSREARVFKYGAGTASNVSSMRGAGEGLSGGATSSGLLAFLTIGEKIAGAIHPGGTEIHARKLATVDVDHPDILDVIALPVRRKQQKTVQSIGAAAYLTHALTVRQAASKGMGAGEGISLHKAAAAAKHDGIPGNVIQEWIGHSGEPLVQPFESEEDKTVFAVRVSDDFMQAAAQKHSWELRSRVGKEVCRAHSAERLLQRLSKSCSDSALLSVHFANPIHAWNSCAREGVIRTSGAEEAFFFHDDTACPMAHINLLSFTDKQSGFDVAAFEHVTRLSAILLDISVANAQYPSKAMAMNCYRLRPIGLSMCNLSPLLMRFGYAYDSEEARQLASAIASLMTGVGYATSAELARELGAFESYSDNVASMRTVVEQHRDVANGRRIDASAFTIQGSALGSDAISAALHRVWDVAYELGKAHGYSNAHISLLADDEIVHAVMEGEYVGVAPMRSLLLTRQTVEGSRRCEVHSSVTAGLEALGYASRQIEAMVRYIGGVRSLNNASVINGNALRVQGFGAEQIAALEAALKDAEHIRDVFDPWVLGEGFCRHVIGLNDQDMHDASFDMLEHLGYDVETVEDANRIICGTGSLSGAPFLRCEDEAVFAVLADQHASVSAAMQLEMMAAVQPSVSGAIASAVTLGRDDTDQEVEQYITRAWKAGLKSVRFAAGDVAPHTLVNAEEDFEQEAMSEGESAKLAIHRPVVAIAAPAPAAAPVQPLPVAGRRALPLRSKGYVQKAWVDEQDVIIRTAEFDDGSLGEVQIELPGASHELQAMVTGVAHAVTLALQYGASLEELSEQFSCGQTQASLLVKGNAHIRQASSVIDYVFRELTSSYGQKAKKLPEAIPAVVSTTLQSA